MNTHTVEWFRTLGGVPGVDWRSPEWLALDSRLMEARPVEARAGHPELGIVWVDVDGRRIADYGFQSPAALALEGQYALRDPNEAIRLMCHALAVPGTRSDYHQALIWLARMTGVPGAWRERGLRADVQLVLSDPIGAVSSRWAGGVTDADVLPQASDPILLLMNLYLDEGFLVEAAEVAQLLDRLPGAPEDRPEFWLRPFQIATALGNLTL